MDAGRRLRHRANWLASAIGRSARVAVALAGAAQGLHAVHHGRSPQKKSAIATACRRPSPIARSAFGCIPSALSSPPRGRLFASIVASLPAPTNRRAPQRFTIGGTIWRSFNASREPCATARPSSNCRPPSNAGNARVRRGLIQLASRFLRFQKDSALAQWYRGRTEDVAGKRKRTMIVALARELLIALWRLVTIGEIPVGVALRTAPLEPCDRTGTE